MKQDAGVLVGAPLVWERLEGLGWLLAGLGGFHFLEGPWGLGFFLFWLPDVGLLGYVAGPKVGSHLYNVSHTFLVAIGLFTLGWLYDVLFLEQLGCLWAAHIGFDRALGFGLKYPDRFKHTHLSAPS